DPNPTDAPMSDHQAGIQTTSQGAPQITGNTFVDLFHGIDVLSPAAGVPGTPLISGNDISGVHDIGDGIEVFGLHNGPPYPVTGTTTATLVGNTIHDHGTGQSVGVFVGDGGSFARDAAAPTTGLTMVRNRIIGGSDGVEVNGTRAPVTMFGDVIARTTFDAVQANSIEVDPPGGIY